MVSTLRIQPAFARTVLAGVLVMGIAACGSDDDAGTASGSYCDNLVAFNSAVFEVDLMPDATEEQIAAVSAELSPVWSAMRESAPDSLSDEVAPLDAVMKALGEGDAGPFNTDETYMQYLAIVDSSIDECDFETASVEAGDYWFDGISDDLSQGTIAVRLTNSSDVEMHEFVVFRKNDPGQSADEILAMDEAAMEGAITFAGATFAPPGESGAGLMQFDSGSYIAMCFIPIDGDGPPHFTAGQVAEFAVK